MDIGKFLGRLTGKDIQSLNELGLRFDPATGQILGEAHAEAIANEANWKLCARDPEHFIIDSKLVYTLDNQKKWDCLACGRITPSHTRVNCKWCGAGTTLRDPFQNFPAHREGPRKILRLLQRESFMAIAKSRRLMATELICAYTLWLLMFKRGKLAVFQSDVEEKANDNVIRVHGMWERLPEWMRLRAPANPTKQGGSIENYFEIPTNHSKLKAIASGPKPIRELGPSFYFCDEAAFHAEGSQTYSAVQGAIEAGCQAVYVSTAAAGFFAGLCLDQLESVSA